MLAKDFDGQDVSGWLASEKLDGVRAYWTGLEFLTRNGNKINVPAWFSDSLPATPLDGELWAGRGLFQSMVSIMRKANSDWSAVRFAVFDAPEAHGGLSQRLDAARSATKGSQRAYVCDQSMVSGNDDAWRVFGDIVNAGGEGIMLRDPASVYEWKRSGSMLKLKALCVEDAVVIAVDPDGIDCRFNGADFRLKMHDKESPPAGSVVTFSCCGFTDQGTPRHASFIEVRDYE